MNNRYSVYATLPHNFFLKKLMNSTKFQLKYIRKQMNVSQREMGELLGITQSGYSEIENGRSNLSSPAQTLICRTFNIDPKIFTTDLPEFDWHRFLNRPQMMQEAEPEYFKRNDSSGISIIMIEKERIEKELEAYREENHKLKIYIREYIDKGQ
jgi:transcriptional regulator with XRE-family HTH domain